MAELQNLENKGVFPHDFGVGKDFFKKVQETLTIAEKKNNSIGYMKIKTMFIKR